MTDGTGSTVVATYPRVAAWSVVLGMGGTSVTYNVWHAVHGGQMNIGLALLYGLAPVFAAALLSHIVAEYNGGRAMTVVTYLVMLGAMGLSIGATASVVAPTAGPWMRWLFGVVLDSAALVALRVILAGRSRKAAVVAGLAEATTAAEAAATLAAERGTEIERLAAENAALQRDLEAERDRTPEAVESAPASVTSMIGRSHSPRTLGAPRDRTPGAQQSASSGAPDLLAEFADELAAGELPSAREIAKRCHVGQDRARKELVPQLRAYLASRGVGDPATAV